IAPHVARLPLTLAARAVVRGALAHDPSLDRSFAPATGQPLAIVNVERLLKVPRAAVPADEIAQGRPAAFQRVAQDVANRIGEGSATRPPDTPRGAGRVNARAVQRFIGIDVPDPGDDPAVHQVLLDGYTPSLSGPP